MRSGAGRFQPRNPPPEWRQVNAHVAEAAGARWGLDADAPRGAEGEEDGAQPADHREERVALRIERTGESLAVHPLGNSEVRLNEQVEKEG